MNKEFKLPSGKILVVGLSSFEEARNLNKALAEELKHIKIDKEMDLNDINLMKDLVCYAFTSDNVMKCLDVCLRRCTYDGLKISADTFEDINARADYLIVAKEVIIENVRPFFQSLLSGLKDLSQEKKA